MNKTFILLALFLLSSCTTQSNYIRADSNSDKYLLDSYIKSRKYIETTLDRFENLERYSLLYYEKADAWILPDSLKSASVDLQMVAYVNFTATNPIIHMYFVIDTDRSTFADSYIKVVIKNRYAKNHVGTKEFRNPYELACIYDNKILKKNIDKTENIINENESYIFYETILYTMLDSDTYFSLLRSKDIEFKLTGFTARTDYFIKIPERSFLKSEEYERYLNEVLF